MGPFLHQNPTVGRRTGNLPPLCGTPLQHPARCTFVATMPPWDLRLPAPQPQRVTGTLRLSPRKLHPLLEEKDLKNDRPNNYFFWTFATHMAQMPPKKYNFTQFAAFFHFLLIKINYYFV